MATSYVRAERRSRCVSFLRDLRAHTTGNLITCWDLYAHRPDGDLTEVSKRGRELVDGAERDGLPFDSTGD